MARATEADAAANAAAGLEILMTAQRRYIEAWANAGQIMADAMQTVARRQAELAESGLREFWTENDAFARARAGEYRPAEELERLRGFYERAFGGFQELSEIMLKAQSEALKVLSDGTAASVEHASRAA